ncbi:type II CAAX endopeptidase family protein [Nocardia altamirensis]|uniref:type II CAAX endopeptidase family protein n=1 Tax=Nocardia altamirensis TaxID=472158 RepID=UPI00114C8D9D|nr:type II CAAX endopeptidase family protein [Nocardia altamirensis]
MTPGRRGGNDVEPPIQVSDQAERRRSARQGVVLFLVALVALSAPATAFAVISRNEIGVLLLMWSPGVAALIARLIRREGIADISLRMGGRRGWLASLLALGYPIIVGSIAYGIGWASGLADYTTPADSATGWPAFAAELFFGTLVGTAIGLVFALGEELGWRGYLLTRLIDAEVPRPILVGGLIWAAWHLPLIIGGSYLTGNGGSMPLIALLFTIQVTVVSFLFARLRLNTGSLWPAVILHASWNHVIQSFFDPHTTGPRTWLWLGEQGLLTLTTNTLAVYLICRRPTRILHQPPAAHPPKGNPG